ncbi:hypothetical protein Zmor_027482 [Zophobas morio]|uniref:Uncharacterized protein n=1 Tax=Zophobas morio TaxID=2755281 RepID=A0AA38HNF3_9CUCU|nr:hypothetical protein Zmor_027482 [Zophobas morio]
MCGNESDGRAYRQSCETGQEPAGYRAWAHRAISITNAGISKCTLSTMRFDTISFNSSVAPLCTELRSGCFRDTNDRINISNLAMVKYLTRRDRLHRCSRLKGLHF